VTDSSIRCKQCGKTHQLDQSCPFCQTLVETKEEIDEKSEIESPPQIGRYPIRGFLGEGGMAKVHRIWHPELEREMALKVLIGGTEELVARFLREAQVACDLTHPSIVRVYEVGSDQAAPYLVMDLIPGPTLNQWLEQDRSIREILERIHDIALALGYAHDRGIVHRDVKPSNILLDGEGRAILTDFGLARRITSEDVRLTESGLLIGTPAYMAPEQALDQEIAPSTDVYALGIVLYEALSGAPPFLDKNPITMLQRLSRGPVPPIRDSRFDLHRDISILLMKAVSHRHSDRYINGTEFAKDIRRFLDGEPIRARPIPYVEHISRWIRSRPITASLACLLLLLTIGGGLFLLDQFRSKRVAVLINQSRTLRRSGHRIEAISLLRKALSLKPQHRDLRLELARIELDSGELESASLRIAPLLDLPHTTEISELRARLLLAQKKPAEALENIQGAVEKNPKVARLKDLESKILLALGQTAESRLARSQARQLRQKEVERALASLPEQNDAKEQQLETLCKAFPDSFQPVEAWVDSLRSHASFEQAESILKRYSGTVPEDPRPHALLAEIARSRGLQRQAIQHLGRCIDLEGRPDDLEARGRILLKLGEFKRAQSDFEAALEQEPTPTRQLLRIRSLCHPDRNATLSGLHWVHIVSLSDQLIEIRPLTWSIDLPEVRKILPALRHSQPDNDEVALTYGDLLFQISAFEGAATVYQKVANRSQSSHALTGLGFSLLALEKRSSALDAFGKAVLVNPLAYEASLGSFLARYSRSRPPLSVSTFFAHGGLFQEHAKYFHPTAAGWIARWGTDAKASIDPLFGTVPDSTPALLQWAIQLESSIETDSLAARQALVAAGLAGLSAIESSFSKPSPRIAAVARQIRRRTLHEESFLLRTLLVKGLFLGDPASRKDLERKSRRFAWTLARIIENEDLPEWFRGLALSVAGPVCSTSSTLRETVLRAHRSQSETLEFHATLPMQQLQGSDVLEEIALGYGKIRLNYQNMFSFLSIERADRIPIGQALRALGDSCTQSRVEFQLLLDRRLSRNQLESVLLRRHGVPFSFPKSSLTNSLDWIVRRQGLDSLKAPARDRKMPIESTWLLAWFLQRWPSPEWIPLARSLTHSEDPWVRCEAAGLLAACGLPREAQPILHELYRQNPNLPGNIAVVDRLTYSFGPSRWIDVIRPYRPGDLRCRVAELLSQIPTPQTVELLISTLPDLPTPIRINALGSLCRLALNPTLRPIVLTKIDSLQELYADSSKLIEPEKTNLALLCGILVPERKLLGTFLQNCSRNPQTSFGMNALWARSQAGDREARKIFLARMEEVIPSGTDNFSAIWRAAFDLENGRYGKAFPQRLLAYEARSNNPLKPPLDALWTTRAWWHLLRGQPQAAADALDRLLERSPSRRKEIETVRDAMLSKKDPIPFPVLWWRTAGVPHVHGRRRLHFLR
jgi:serine/threonine protein kinase